jgi:hypothetical protein
MVGHLALSLPGAIGPGEAEHRFRITSANDQGATQVAPTSETLCRQRGRFPVFFASAYAKAARWIPFCSGNRHNNLWTQQQPMTGLARTSLL